MNQLHHPISAQTPTRRPPPTAASSAMQAGAAAVPATAASPQSVPAPRASASTHRCGQSRLQTPMPPATSQPPAAHCAAGCRTRRPRIHVWIEPPPEHRASVDFSPRTMVLVMPKRATPIKAKTRITGRSNTSRGDSVAAASTLTSAPANAGTTSRAVFMTDADEESILALVITVGSGAMQISEQSARLRQAADKIPDFAHYSRLLRRSMKQAFDLGQSERKRRTGAAKGSWRRIFKHFARRLGIGQDIEIFSLDRAGNYDCRMTVKVTPDREWRGFVKQGRKYFIFARELKVLAEKAKLREERRAGSAERTGRNRAT